jgi:CheY-like chemotaxis protein
MKKIIFIDRVKQTVGIDFFEEVPDAEFITAYSNEDALRVQAREKAGVIITELYGSGMNAREFCDRIREDKALRDVSIIVCCRDNEVERAEAVKCRANAVMTLPLRGSLLRRAINEFLSVPARGAFHAQFSAHTSGPRGLAVACRTENISVTGMLIRADTELRRGDRLLYSLDLAPARSFAMQAEVVRSDRGRYGLRFSRLDPAARKAIEALVSRSPSPQ